MEHTPEYVREHLRYEQQTGLLFWRLPRKKRRMGRPAGSLSRSDGYFWIMLDGQRYAAHRLVWIIVHGCWPKNELDHINRDRTDNRVQNLRKATHLENTYNRKRYTSNTSGIPGISYVTSRQKWNAHINFDGRQKNLGNYRTFEEAVNVRKEAERSHHGVFSSSLVDKP